MKLLSVLVYVRILAIALAKQVRRTQLDALVGIASVFSLVAVSPVGAEEVGAKGISPLLEQYLNSTFSSFAHQESEKILRTNRDTTMVILVNEQKTGLPNYLRKD